MMRDLLVSLVSGTIFGAGLALGGMTDPARVRGFLDIFGNWDPTLAFVMGGAVIVMALAWAMQRRMLRPVFGEGFALPDRSDITLRLVGGSALFGIGWGIAGLCPGPGFAAIAIAPPSAAIFVAAMLAGMLLVRLREGKA
ncbi:YeeE/YedE family protein [Erythrobacter sp. NFXS35]